MSTKIDENKHFIYKTLADIPPVSLEETFRLAYIGLTINNLCDRWTQFKARGTSNTFITSIYYDAYLAAKSARAEFIASKQMDLIASRDKAMLIFLGKSELGQSDTQSATIDIPTESTGYSINIIKKKDD